MENNKKNHAFGVTFTGDVTFQGPMFDIHDNEHVHISAEKMPHEELVDDQLEMATDITQLPQVEEELNYFQPQLHLKRLFEMEWFEICRAKPVYTRKWGEGVVEALMESKWKDHIAREWSVPKKRYEIKGHLMGILKDAGALKGSYDSISMVARIHDNARTFSRYMSRAKKQPFYTWLLGYVKQSLENT